MRSKMMKSNAGMEVCPVITAQFISDFDEQRRLERETLDLCHRPLDTLQTFVLATVSFVFLSVRYITTHSFVLYFILPMVIVWLILEQIPGPYSDAINKIEFAVQYIVWWTGLGILSSIGLGSGLQSGVLFLFPHVIKVCLAAQTCKSLDFEAASDMWFRAPKNLFKCNPMSTDTTPVTLFGMWSKIILACFLQSAGTALGEIPPYWMTRAARLASIEAGRSSSDMPEELEAKSKFGLVNRVKSWMISFLRTHGFYGVMFMASYPNIAFDLCGICCGHFLMPFWTFFWATFIGKAIVRNGYQSVLYVILCTEVYLEKFIQLVEYLTPDRLNIDKMLRAAIEEGRDSFKDMVTPGKEVDPDKHAAEDKLSSSAILQFWWKLFLFSLLSIFFVSCISHFAQYYQLRIDQEDSKKLRKKLPHSVLSELMSPATGRLRLPPPTPVEPKKAQDKQKLRTAD